MGHSCRTLVGHSCGTIESTAGLPPTEKVEVESRDSHHAHLACVSIGGFTTGFREET